MAASVTLRPETEADVPLLQSIYAGTRAEEMALAPWTDQQKREFLAMQFRYQRQHYLQHYSGSNFDIIEVDGEPAGRLYVFRGPADIRIVDIALLPEFRGRGIGTQLLQGILGEGRQSGRIVSIHVERNNPALRLYLRLGFQVAGEEGPVYLKMEYRPAPG